MSVARHHTEWLSLVETSGPFLSLMVLMEVFPQGLDTLNGEHARQLRVAFDEWRANNESTPPNPAIHRAWQMFVLRETLGFVDEVRLEGQRIPDTLKAVLSEYGETLRPSLVICDPDTRRPHLLVMLLPSEQDVERPVSGSRWKVSPATRMTELLHATNVRLGLVTNGQQWLLVNAPRGETTGFATWYANLMVEEPDLLRSFCSLLGVSRFFGVAEKDTLGEMLARSTSDQQEVTEQLGYQVRKAVEVLVQTLDRIDKNSGRTLLAGMTEAEIYEAALTVMMRLVFLFSAEERDLLLLGDALYDQYYAVSTLREKLREEADRSGEEILERRLDAWPRLLATFRAVYAGVRHDAFQLPAYGGKLFDPDKYPFLEGRKVGTIWREVAAKPITVDNRTVLHLLEALQILTVQIPGGGAEPRRLSFRALDVEQIGHVYEGLLDHTAVRAASPVLGLTGTRNNEPEIQLETLETLFAKGEVEALKFLKDETGRSPAAIKNALKREPTGHEVQQLLTACEHDEALLERVKPFAGLLRRDTHGLPVVIPPAGIFVTKGTDRRATGTHYTPRSLTEEIVRYTLEPLVYVGPAEGLPREEWKLKSAKEILALKVCDFAMGSGAFLVQTCRYLAEHLVASWEAVEAAHPGQVISTPEGMLSEAAASESPIPKDPEERLTVARRIVADRCIYGVDINPMAVEMAKLSLWLTTLQKNRPFTFLDHALRCGDSLLGVTSLKQIEYLSLHPDEAGQMPLVAQDFQQWIRTALAKRSELEAIPDNDISDIEYKTLLFSEAEAATDNIRFIADLLIAESLRNIGRPRADMAAELMDLSDEVALALDISQEQRALRIASLRQKAVRLLNGRRPFHWSLEFPEVFSANPEPGTRNPEPGFDAIVGNPPFMGGSKITGFLGTDYREFLVEHLANGQRGNADLCAYFFLQAQSLLKSQGHFGLVATNTIAQGDTCEVGLDQIIRNNSTIYRAVPSVPWPGTASLEVAKVWLRNNSAWVGQCFLDEKMVSGISTLLSSKSKVEGKPYRLVANSNKSFTGNKVYGEGFVLTPEIAQELIKQNPKNSEVIFPYLNGEDLNSNPDQKPSRWVINFHDWPLDANHDSLEKPKGPPYASDYPECLNIVEKLVKPYRETVNREHTRERWWQHEHTRKELYSTIEGMERVLIRSQVSKTQQSHFVKNGFVYDQGSTTLNRGHKHHLRMVV